jgi:ABC-type transporter Mla subunit MlaD
VQPHILPTITAARSLVEDVSPKLKVASTNLVEASQTLRRQADHVTATIDDLLSKTTAQANRVDEIVTAGIDSAAHATHAVQHAVSVPVRQASALFAGLKAGFDVLRGRNNSQRPPHDDFRRVDEFSE